MSFPPSRSSNPSGSSSRRSSGQSKSGRKQYSACGACRIRRVRCDLRDLQDASAGDLPQVCTNCSERGINCVDEYVDFKRRPSGPLQRSGDSDGQILGISPTSSTFGHSSVSPERNVIQGIVMPVPHSDFFRSTFFRNFSLQNQIFDPTDFQFIDSNSDQLNGISIERRLLATVLLAWAASFGLDERGVAGKSDTRQNTHTSGMTPEVHSGSGQTQRARTDTLVNGILGLVDSRGLMRSPTWDGVRLLLLVWPLTRGTQRSLERTTMFESILSQVHALCRFESNALAQTGQDCYSECLSRARIFWYAYTYEGITNALKGGRLFMDEDDLDGFQQTLPPQPFSVTHAPIPSSSALSNTMFHATGIDTPPPFSDVVQAMADSRYRSHSRTLLLYQLTTHHFDLTLHVAAVCRKIHAILTGPKARQFATDHGGFLKVEDMSAIWNGLHRCWDEFEGARDSGLWNGGVDEPCPAGDVDIFVSGWQIFLFECHNIIREALKQRILQKQPETSMPFSAHAVPVGPQGNNIFDLHVHATHKCRQILPNVLIILKRHLYTSTSTLFAADVGLIRDGCAFAGFMLAHGDLEGDNNVESLQSLMSLNEGIEICVRTLDRMRWTFSGSMNTKQKLINAWNARKSRDRERHAHPQDHTGYYPAQPGSSHEWSSQAPSYGHPLGAYDSASVSSDSAYSLAGPNSEMNPWIYSSSSGVTDAQHMPNVDSASPSSTFSPEGWFGHNPARR